MSQSPAYVLNVVTPPTGDVVTVAEMQTVLRVSDAAEADYLQTLIDGAVELVQGNTGKQLLTSTYELSLLCFPTGAIELPFMPLQSIASVKYDDETGTEQTLSPSRYSVQLGSPRRRGSVIPAYGTCWPTVRHHNRPVRVTFTCGFGSQSDIPQTYIQQVRLQVANWFRNRSSVTCGSMGRAALSYDTLQDFNEIKEFF